MAQTAQDGAQMAQIAQGGAASGAWRSPLRAESANGAARPGRSRKWRSPLRAEPQMAQTAEGVAAKVAARSGRSRRWRSQLRAEPPRA
jgi:hypothetical protein